MKKKAINIFALGRWLGLAIIPLTATAVPVPGISISSTNSSALTLTVSNVAVGNTYHVEHNTTLATNGWQDVYSFDGSATNTDWNVPTTNSVDFFRVVAVPNNTKIGQTATLSTIEQNVSGTAHIVDEHNIEIDNFNFAGGGIDVRVVISPNSSFSPYTSLTGNLVGTPYTNATLHLTIPQGVNLADVNYIVVYCVDIPVSFGDGMFQ